MSMNIVILTPLNLGVISYILTTNQMIFVALDASTQGTPVNTASNNESLALGAGSDRKPGGLAEHVSQSLAF